MNRKLCLLLAGALVLFTISANAYAQSQVNRLEGTFWAGTDSDGSPFVFEFQKSGKFKYVPATGVISKGRWKLNASSLDIEINGKFVEFTGNLENDRMEGMASSRAGRTWKWSATKQPIVIASSAPPYPPIAAAARAMGNVVVEVQINAEGIVTSARALNGYPLLQTAALAASRTWKFERTTESNQNRTAQITFIFNIPSDDRKVKSPIFLSPYQAEIRRRVVVVSQPSYSTAQSK